MPIKKFLKALLPALIIVSIAGAIGWWMMKNREQPVTQTPEETVTRAEFVRVRKEDYQVTLKTTGVVLPRTQTTLLPQVAGEVLRVSPNFRNGGFFDVGEVLLELDDRDYVAAVTESAATLAQAGAAYKLEEARAAQAIASWKELGRGGEPSELTMRKPQLAEAKAAADAAGARLARARRDLERTKIVAPYAGYVRQKSVDLGQFVGQGTALGEVFAIDYVEVRLSLAPNDLKFIDLPEHYRTGEVSGARQASVVLRDSNTPGISWKGKIVRAEGEFDSRSRKLFVVAQVDDPYGLKEPGRPPLKIGQFVNAEIEGKMLSGVFVVPEQGVRFGNEIKVIDNENRIRFRTVDLIWSDFPKHLLRHGIEEGERLCLTTLPFAVEGSLVDPVEKDSHLPDPKRSLQGAHAELTKAEVSP